MQTDTRRVPHEGGDRDWGDAGTSREHQGQPAATRSYGRGAEQTLPQKELTLTTGPDFRPPASRIMKKKIVLSHPVCGMSPWQL